MIDVPFPMTAEVKILFFAADDNEESVVVAVVPVGGGVVGPALFRSETRAEGGRGMIFILFFKVENKRFGHFFTFFGD